MEEAEDLARDEEQEARPSGPRDIVQEAEDGAIRWLGLDAFHEGDDVRLAMHPKGHGVLVFISTRRGEPYGTTTLKVSRQQIDKLKKIMEDL